MQISQVKQLSAVDGWIDFNGQIKECKEIRQRTKSNLSKTPGQQYNVQKLIIIDNTGSISGWAYADKQFIPGMRVSVHGQLKEHMGTKYFDYADVKPLQNGQNNAQQAAQQDEYAINDKFVIENRQKAAMCASKALGGTGVDEPIQVVVKILDIAAPLAQWFITGKAPNMNSFDKFAKDNPVENDNIPDY